MRQVKRQWWLAFAMAAILAAIPVFFMRAEGTPFPAKPVAAAEASEASLFTCTLSMVDGYPNIVQATDSICINAGKLFEVNTKVNCTGTGMIPCSSASVWVSSYEYTSLCGWTYFGQGCVYTASAICGYNAGGTWYCWNPSQDYPIKNGNLWKFEAQTYLGGCGSKGATIGSESCITLQWDACTGTYTYGTCP